MIISSTPTKGQHRCGPIINTTKKTKNGYILLLLWANFCYIEVITYWQTAEGENATVKRDESKHKILCDQPL
jgi:hypothetical protein